MNDFAKKRALSNEDLMLKGLKYQFSLKDLPKYSKRLHSRDLSDRFTRTALGKRAPTLAERLRQLEALQRKMKE